MTYTAYRLPDGSFAVVADGREIVLRTRDKAAYEEKLRELFPEIATDSAYARSVRRWRADHEIMTWPSQSSETKSAVRSTLQGWKTA